MNEARKLNGSSVRTGAAAGAREGQLLEQVTQVPVRFAPVRLGGLDQPSSPQDGSSASASGAEAAQTGQALAATTPQ